MEDVDLWSERNHSLPDFPRGSTITCSNGFNVQCLSTTIDEGCGSVGNDVDPGVDPLAMFVPELRWDPEAGSWVSQYIHTDGWRKV